jgi:hypothetical protein
VGGQRSHRVLEVLECIGDGGEGVIWMLDNPVASMILEKLTRQRCAGEPAA